MGNDHIEGLRENLDLLTNVLLEGERLLKEGALPPNLVHLLFRYAHNSKGGFGLIGGDAALSFIHVFESVLDGVRRGQATLNQDIIDLSLEGVTLLLESLGGPSNDEQLGSLQEKMEKFSVVNSETNEVKAKKISLKIQSSLNELILRGKPNGLKIFCVEKNVSSSISAQQFKSLPILEDIENAEGVCLGITPELSRFDTNQREQLIQICFASFKPLEVLRDTIYDPVFPVELETIVPREINESSDKKRPLRILLVEDELISRTVLRNLVRPLGTCDVAVDGQEAIVSYLLALEDGEPYDLVMLDIGLPNLDGRTMLRYVRKAEEERHKIGSKGVKVIMITAATDKENILGSFRDGCEGYLTKPLKRDKFKNLLVKLGIDPRN